MRGHVSILSGDSPRVRMGKSRSRWNLVPLNFWLSQINSRSMGCVGMWCGVGLSCVWGGVIIFVLVLVMWVWLSGDVCLVRFLFSRPTLAQTLAWLNPRQPRPPTSPPNAPRKPPPYIPFCHIPHTTLTVHEDILLVPKTTMVNRRHMEGTNALFWLPHPLCTASTRHPLVPLSCAHISYSPTQPSTQQDHPAYCLGIFRSHGNLQKWPNSSYHLVVVCFRATTAHALKSRRLIATRGRVWVKTLTAIVRLRFDNESSVLKDLAKEVVHDSAWCRKACSTNITPCMQWISAKLCEVVIDYSRSRSNSQIMMFLISALLSCICKVTDVSSSQPRRDAQY